MSNETRLFHVNSFVSARRQENVGFGPFVAAGAATIGFISVTQSFLNLRNMVPPMPMPQIREQLEEEYRNDAEDRSGVWQVWMWHTQVRIGDFILLRHEYPTCPHLPEALCENGEGDYIGPVYVLGVVTGLPTDEDIGLRESLLTMFPDDFHVGDMELYLVQSRLPLDG